MGQSLPQLYMIVVGVQVDRCRCLVPRRHLRQIAASDDGGRAMTLLSIDAVVKSFAGVVALDHVSFDVGEGEFVGIMGANGAGKTTLFSVIAGNLRANDGSITFDGRRIDGLRPDQISRQGVARTFQIVRPFGNMTVLENVSLGVLYGRRRERSAAVAEAKAGEILDRLGLSAPRAASRH